MQKLNGMSILFIYIKLFYISFVYVSAPKRSPVKGVQQMTNIESLTSGDAVNVVFNPDKEFDAILATIDSDESAST